MIRFGFFEVLAVDVTVGHVQFPDPKCKKEFAALFQAVGVRYFKVPNGRFL